MLAPDDSKFTGLIDRGMNVDLYSMNVCGFRRQSFDDRGFACATEAIRFAVEDLPPQLLASTYLEGDASRYRSVEIRRLYDGADYARRVAGSLT